MVTTADLITQIELELDNAVERAEEFYKDTLHAKDWGFLEGMEAARDMIERIVYEYSAIVERAEELRDYDELG